ncbi:uncharacterized protein [Temnothorax nylanderi]|uniref:uncharacterized protein n=1 Tax=Temnothorax nylanderi TaxID=102681 RepID=UPI003A871C47
MDDNKIVHDETYEKSVKIEAIEPEQRNVDVEVKLARDVRGSLGLELSLELCVVCGDRTSRRHYGAISCDGCHGFFKRSIRKQLSYQCRGSKNCEVTKHDRNRCQYCRLQKCLAMGMRSDSVQYERKPVLGESAATKVGSRSPRVKPVPNSENIDVVEVPSSVGYHSLPVHDTVTPRPKRRKHYTAETKTHCEKLLPATLPKRENSDLKSKLNRFRPIRPKPLQLDVFSVVLLPRHTFELQPDMMNMTTSPSNRVVVPSTVLVKEIITPSDSNTINENDTNNSNSNLNDSYSDNSSCRKNSSIQLFFESMTQTMLSLPKEVQARVKMQICEIVTKAEIQHCESQAKSKTEN